MTRAAATASARPSPAGSTSSWPRSGTCAPRGPPWRTSSAPPSPPAPARPPGTTSLVSGSTPKSCSAFPGHLRSRGPVTAAPYPTSTVSRTKKARAPERAVSRVLSLATIHLGPTLPSGSSDQPGVIVRATRPLSGLASGGVCLALSVTRRGGALLPHPFTLTADVATAGGLLSVALSCESPRLAVNQHPAL